MQSEKMQIRSMRANIEKIVKTILRYYMENEYMNQTNIEDVQYKNPRFYLPLESLYLGAQSTTGLLNNTVNLQPNDIKQFKLRILDFYVEGVSQIFKRFAFKDEVFKHLEILDPIVAKSNTYLSLAPLASRFPNLVEEADLQKLDDEWHELKNTDINSDNSLEDFWKSVKLQKFADDSLISPVLSRFVDHLMCLPHSSATVERVFSQMNINKTKQRNRLRSKTLCGIMHTKRVLNNSNCYSNVPKKK